MWQLSRRKKHILLTITCFVCAHTAVAQTFGRQARKCELEVYFTSQHDKDNVFQSTLTLNNNRNIPLSSWQVVWTFGRGNVIQSGSLDGALSLSQGSASGAPARVVNNGGNDVVDADGGVRTFTFNTLSNTTVFPQGARAIGDVSFNGLTCDRFGDSFENGAEQCPCHHLEELYCLQEEREDFYGIEALAPEAELSTDPVADSGFVEQCVASYCCGESFDDSPPSPPDEPEGLPPEVSPITIYENGTLLRGWRNLSNGGQFSMQGDDGRTSNTSISVQITDRDGALVLNSEIPFGPRYGDYSFEFYILGSEEVGQLLVEFYNLRATNVSSEPTTVGEDPAKFTEALLNFFVEEQESNRTSQVFSNGSDVNWKLARVPFDVVSAAMEPEESWDTFALRDVLGVLPPFYIDDIAIQTLSISDREGSVGEPGTTPPDSSDGAAPSPSNDQNTESSSSVVVPVVIAVCVAVVVALAAGFGCLIYIRKRRKREGIKGNINGRKDTLGRNGKGNSWSRRVPAASSTRSGSGRESGGASTRRFSHAPSQGQLDIEFDEEIELGEMLGSGAFGSVYRGTWNGRPVAIKMMHGMLFEENSRDLLNFQQEVSVLSRLDHDHIIKFYGACVQPPQVCLVEELAEGGSLHDLLHTNETKAPLSYSATLKLGEEIASAMAYLHPTVVHRDLKSQNVLLDRDGKAKVCDFGIAKFKDHTFLTTRNVQAGTPSYMAPEMFAAGDVDEKCDVFSFAVLLWECITGRTPWETYTSPMQIIFAVGVQRIRPEIPLDTPGMLRELIEECWEHSPAKRPSFTLILDRIQDELHRLGVETVPRSNVNVQALGLDVSPVSIAEDVALVPKSS